MWLKRKVENRGVMDCKGVEQRSGHMVRGQVAVLEGAEHAERTESR